MGKQMLRYGIENHRDRLSDAFVDVSSIYCEQTLELRPLLAQSRTILGAMERMAARVLALREAVGGDSAILSRQVRKGVTVADFFQRFEAAKDRDLQRIAALRKAAKILKRATAGREGG